MRTLLRAVAEPRATRAAYWNEVVAGCLGGLDLRLDDGPDDRDELLVGTVGPLQVAVSRSGPGEATRTAAHARREDPGHYALFVQAEGLTVSEQDGRVARFAPGDIGICDLSRPLHCAYSERRAVMLSYPKALSPLPEHRVADLTGVGIPGSDGTAALVSGLVRQLPEHLDADDGARGARIGSAILDLVNVGLAARLDQERTLPVETRSRALLHRCRGFIESHLADAALTPSAVAAAHHISLRYLHRLFEPTGESVAALIRSRRLDRCRRDLLDPSLQDRPVAAIGARWGLASPAHFNRAFKLQFGLPPAEYRAVHGAWDGNRLAL
ncbi:helix-turn-helix domain-containing protein [Kribbella pittospori]|uniref:Helix-turn-helix domain-containing protein n=1 Tax=Kribbella pittospori TaxID=722689 RepID=A0A4R0KFW2_9ACTN|nr:helix-turn-helix domain-containing protein [Kribbella pittospori]TCC57416.1 helix-turn-helix domain-containing protein [Kribbella pittospori]